MLLQMTSLYITPPHLTLHGQERINPVSEATELEWVAGQDGDYKCQGWVPVHLPILLWLPDSFLMTQAGLLSSLQTPTSSRCDL